MRIFDSPIGYSAELPKGTKLFYQTGTRKYRAFVTLAKTSDKWQTGYIVRLDEVETNEIQNSILNEKLIGDVFLAGANELYFYEVDEDING